MPLEDEYAKPVDYHALLDDTTVKNILAEIISLKGFSIATSKATALEIDALLAGIDREVSELRGRSTPSPTPLFSIEGEGCVRSVGQLRIIASIEEPRIIAKILKSVAGGRLGLAVRPVTRSDRAGKVV
jgi:hypothetical protein